MKLKSLFIAAIVAVLFLLFAAWLVFFFQSTMTLKRSFNANDNNKTAPVAQNIRSHAVFNPPALEEAPEGIREAVLLGYKIMTETKKYAGEYVGNDLSCTNCHFDGGRSKDTISPVS